MSKHKHEQSEEASLTISKVTIWKALTAIFAILFAASLLTGGFSDNRILGTFKVGTAPIANTGSGTQVNLDGAYVLGDENAPVTIVEWSDFQCPFCARFYTQTHGQIKEQYIDTGKVKLIFKHFPLDSIHPMATPAAIAAECAGAQGKFFDYHDKLFENNNALSEANFKIWASDLGLDLAAFDSCYKDKEFLSKIRADLSEGQANGIRGTPGFLINGKLVSGAQPFQVFQAAIEAELN